MKSILTACLVLALSPAAYADDLADQILSVHNRERAEVGVPAVTWSADLAQDAQRWADHLAATGVFEHAGKDENPAFGENLAMASIGSQTAGQLAELWAGEKSLFKYGEFPNVSTDGNWANVGHYTQMIWTDTEAIGCGIATGASSDFLVCRYDPPGNYNGQTPW